MVLKVKRSALFAIFEYQTYSIMMKILLLSISFLMISVFTLNAQNALHFDGVDDYVLTGNQGLSGTNARTIEAWIKTTVVSNPNSGGTQQVIVDWGSFVTGGRFTFNLLFNNAIRIEVGGNGLSGTVAVNDGQWHHVAVVYDPLATNQYALYVDGVLDVQGNLTVPTNTVLGTPISIGKRVDGAKYFEGTIDEVRVWDVAKTAAQLNASKNIEFCGATSNLIAYYKFNHGTAGASNSGVTTLTDYSASASNGTLNGFSLSGSSSNWVAGKSLTVGAGTTATVNMSSCGPQVSPSGLYTWTNSNTYMDTIANVAGCDSIMTINLTILESTSDSIVVSTCDSYTTPSGALLQSSGNYIDTIPNAAGCDSVVYIDLTVTSLNLGVHFDTASLTLTSLDANATSYQWIRCDMNFSPVSGANSAVFTPTVNGFYAVIVTNGNCSDTSDCHFILGASIHNASRELNAAVYPNPSNGNFEIQLGRKYQAIELKVYTLSGAHLISKTVNNNDALKLNLSDLNSGVYLLRIFADNAVTYKKLVLR
jgi:hypothetical protein